MAKMIQCKSCSKEIASNAKSCPGCGAKNKKPVYLRPWFIIIAILLVIGVIGANGEDDSKVANNGATIEDNQVADNQNTESVAPTEETESPVEEKKDDVPTEYKSALKKAKLYSDTMNMSKAGLYDQLTSEYGEKFPAEAAQYAIDNVAADWNENALKKAKVYLESMAMSTSAIYDQLVSEYGEKFTAEEAQYAIDNLE